MTRTTKMINLAIEQAKLIILVVLVILIELIELIELNRIIYNLQ